ncbi:MAG: hypothetical protein NTX36_13315 [Proteobacteria bacterium]|nr:hypothetical protein [Pseudomonadota bacterium]
MNLKVAGNHIITKILNIVLPLAGITLMLVYEYCDTSCLYLKGTFMGIDLKWVGITYMIILFASAFSVRGSFDQMAAHFRTILISAAVGVEFFLIGWQIANNTYCLFCLAFSACIFILFGLNFPSMNKKLMVVSILAALLGFILFFEGQVGPRYDLAISGAHVAPSFKF